MNAKCDKNQGKNIKKNQTEMEMPTRERSQRNETVLFAADGSEFTPTIELECSAID